MNIKRETQTLLERFKYYPQADHVAPLGVQVTDAMVTVSV